MPNNEPNQSGQGQKEENKIEETGEKKNLAALLAGAFIFALTQFLGIVTAVRLKGFFAAANITVSAPSIGDFLISFAIATAFLLFIIYFLKFRKIKRALFKIIFSLVVFTGAIMFLGVWFDETTPFVLAFLLVLAWWAYPTVLVQNISVVFGMLGAGLSLGFVLPPETVVILLVIFSVYDFAAVYLTKHMVVMAKEMLVSGAIAAIFIPPGVSDLGEKMEMAAASKLKYMIVGGGDIVFPLLFSVSMVKYADVSGAVTVAIFSLIGFCVSFYLFAFQKIKKPIPALPAIALFSILGYLVSIIL